MITVIPASSRGHTRIGWLDSRHSFSFGDYHDPSRMGFRTLRVINDDRVTPGAGFPTHSHRDMEIISIVLDGALEHKDSLGNGEVLRPGEVQVMSAGSGIRHSEFNPSQTEPAHFLQVWIMPDARGHTPRYDQAPFPAAGRAGQLVRVAGPLRASDQNAPRSSDGALMIHQDADLYLASLAAGQSLKHALRPGRAAYIHIIAGRLRVGGHTLGPGDAVQIEQEPALSLDAEAPGTEVLLFDLA